MCDHPGTRIGAIDGDMNIHTPTNQVSILFPESVLLAAGQSREEFVRDAPFLLALKRFELGRLSSGKAAQLCGMGRVDFLLIAGRMGIAVADLDEEEMRREFGEPPPRRPQDAILPDRS